MGKAWFALAGLLLAGVALGVGVWFSWLLIRWYGVLIEHPEYAAVASPAQETLYCVSRTVPSLVCGAIAMCCALAALRSPVRWHWRLALVDFTMACLAVVLLMVSYWAAWGPMYYVTPLGGRYRPKADRQHGARADQPTTKTPKVPAASGPEATGRHHRKVSSAS